MSPVCYLLPQSGISLLSAFMTMDDIVMVTGMASKYEEWGARVRMGASAGNALRPFTVIQWKPPANHMTRMMIFRMMSTNLEGRDMHIWGWGVKFHARTSCTYRKGTYLLQRHWGSTVVSERPTVARKAKGQASSIMKAAMNRRMGNSVTVIKAIWGTEGKSRRD